MRAEGSAGAGADAGASSPPSPSCGAAAGRMGGVAGVPRALLDGGSHCVPDGVVSTPSPALAGVYSVMVAGKKPAGRDQYTLMRRPKMRSPGGRVVVSTSHSTLRLFRSAYSSSVG